MSGLSECAYNEYKELPVPSSGPLAVLGDVSPLPLVTVGGYSLTTVF